MKRFLKCITALLRGPEVTHTCGNAKCVNPDHTRLLFGAMLALSVLAAPMAANAGWVQEELGWQKTNVGGFNGTSVWVRDTAFTALAGGKTVKDTTSTFSLRYAQLFRVGQASGAGSRGDSLVSAYLVFQMDSSVATNTMQNITIAIDGRAAPAGSGAVHSNWTMIDSLSTGGFASAHTIVWPIRATGHITAGVNPFAVEHLRARTVAGLGIMHQARVFFRYWKP